MCLLTHVCFMVLVRLGKAECMCEWCVLDCDMCVVLVARVVCG